MEVSEVTARSLDHADFVRPRVVPNHPKRNIVSIASDIRSPEGLCAPIIRSSEGSRHTGFVAAELGKKD